MLQEPCFFCKLASQSFLTAMRFFFYIRSLVIALWLVLGFITVSRAQAPLKQPSSKIFQDILKLNVLGNVLYFAAHPDDENTAFIAYMANEKLYNTSYLSLTRGDGGQNLIGPEIREHLGMIRTQELLQARRIDGGKQYFTRANDFGFSKSSEETFTIWDKDKVLADAVWVIRNTRPDVIVTRFPPDARAGHGHHSASSLLAEEAFDAAGDPSRFPEQLKYLQPWKAKRLLWNLGVWSFSSREELLKHAEGFLKVDIGTYNARLGKSYGELSAESRSMHKSQGFGSLSTRGSTIEYFQHTKGEKATADLFQGVNTSWARVKGGQEVEKAVKSLIQRFKVSDPSLSVPDLLAVKKQLTRLPDGYWKSVKLAEADQLLKELLGLYLEATAQRPAYTPGERMEVNLEMLNRSAVPVMVKSIHIPFGTVDSAMVVPLRNNVPNHMTWKLDIPGSAGYSQPYWLRTGIGYAGLFSVEDQREIGLAENIPPVVFRVTLSVAGETLRLDVPVVNRRKDPVAGEVYRPLVITPPVFVNLDQDVYVFDAVVEKVVRVKVQAGKDGCRGAVSIDLPPDWRVSPAAIDFELPTRGEEKWFEFRVMPPGVTADAELKARVTLDGEVYNRGFGQIVYSHIPTQVYFPEASSRAVKLDLVKKGERIGYIMGAGDVIPSSLRQIGYQVTVLSDQDIYLDNLKRFDAVILGVRAYNTLERLRFHQRTLMNYVKEGGNLIVQYNTDGSLVVPELGPYPLQLGRERVSVENAEVRILKPDSRVLNYPNKITSKDFDGWVQERGLYFPREWASEYEAPISSNDPGSNPLDGGILVARYGKGNYVYTSLSWFRELPAGVPGAYRMFVNLISVGK